MKKIDPMKLYYDKDFYKDHSIDNVISFPKMLLIQASSSCNFKCIQCFREIMVPRRKISGLGEGYISLELIEKISDECKDKKDFIGIHFALYGEPLLNPNLVDIVKVIKSRNLKCQIVTNGYFLNEKMINNLIDARLDKIKVSFQGTNKERYEFWRNNEHYDLIVKHIKMLVKIRDQKGSDLFIQVGTSSADDTEDELNDFVAYWGNIVDHAYWNYTSLLHIADNPKLKEIEILRQSERRTEQCWDPFLRMSVPWNGKVGRCVEDEENYVGDLNHQTIDEVWNGEEFMSVRKTLVEKGNVFDCCRYCGMEPNETIRDYTYRYSENEA